MACQWQAGGLPVVCQMACQNLSPFFPILGIWFANGLPDGLPDYILSYIPLFLEILAAVTMVLVSPEPEMAKMQSPALIAGEMVSPTT